MGFKVPSLVKLPKHRRFEFEPRYYDPIKERIEKRTREMEAELRGTKPSSDSAHASRIRGSFARPAKKKGLVGGFQTIFILLLATALGGFIFFGNTALWIAAALMVGYMTAKALRFLK